MQRKINKSKHYKYSAEFRQTVIDYFLNTGDTCVNIASKFSISINMAVRITDDALNKEYESKRAKPQTQS